MFYNYLRNPVQELSLTMDVIRSCLVFYIDYIGARDLSRILVDSDVS